MSRRRRSNDLIRIEDAIKVLCRRVCHPGMFCPDAYCTEMWELLEDVERVDAVEVVRCRDCKRWDKYHNEQIGECKWTFQVTKAEGYCNYGERKDGDSHDGS